MSSRSLVDYGPRCLNEMLEVLHRQFFEDAGLANEQNVETDFPDTCESAFFTPHKLIVSFEAARYSQCSALTPGCNCSLVDSDCPFRLWPEPRFAKVSRGV